jgi:hypothetical protein
MECGTAVWLRQLSFSRGFMKRLSNRREERLEHGTCPDVLVGAVIMPRRRAVRETHRRGEMYAFPHREACTAALRVSLLSRPTP